MNPNSPNGGNGGNSYKPTGPVNPYANTGVSPNLGKNNSMRHAASQVVGVNIAQAPAPVDTSSKDSGAAGRMIALVVACLTAAVAIIVMVSIFVKWQNLINNGESDTLAYIEASKLKQQQDDALEYLERDKQPWETFNGIPDNLGALRFKYPKNWSAYVESDGLGGSDFVAYFRPSEVLPVSDSRSRYSLRINITQASYDSVIESYDELATKLAENEEGPMELKTVGSLSNYKDSSMRYDGVLVEDGSISGSVVILKVNNMVATFQCDSEIYITDFNQLLSTLERGNWL